MKLKLTQKIFTLILLCVICILSFFFLSTKSLILDNLIYAASTHDMGDSSNYNLRFDGAAASAQFSSGGNTQGFITGDVDNDGLLDLLIVSPGNKSVYLIYGSLIAAHGTSTFDMSDSDDYTFRFYSASNYLTALDLEDIDGDNQADIIIGMPDGDNTRTDSGSVYVIYADLLSTYFGQNINIATASNYNLRFDGPAGYILGAKLGSTMGKAIDLNGSSYKDLALGSTRFGVSPKVMQGVVFVIYDTVFSALSGTGNNIDLNTSTNYNLRFIGPSDSDQLTIDSNFGFGDFDNDGANDILIATPYCYYYSGQPGCLFVIYNSFLDDYPDTGNSFDLSSSSSYNLRIAGAITGGNLGHGPFLADIDGDGSNDLLVSDPGTDYNSLSNSGSTYLLYDDLLSGYTGTGNSFDLTDSANYHLRFDGAVASSGIRGENKSVDIDLDGQNDILFASFYTNYNGSLTGSLYVVYNSIFSSLTSQGNTFGLSSSSNYSVRYDGATNVLGTEPKLGYFGLETADINNDDREDILVTERNADNNSRQDSGSLYIIYNFPHTITDNSTITSPTNSSSVTASGSITATNSVTNIAGAQYRIDSNSALPASSWSECTAADGAFDSTSESYSCSLDLTGLTDGTHTAYFRAYDDNISYTASSSFPSTSSFTTDTQGPNSSRNINNQNNNPTAPNDYPFETIDFKGYTATNLSPNLSFSKATDVTTSVASYSVSLDAGKNMFYSISGIPASGDSSKKEYTWKDDDCNGSNQHCTLQCNGQSCVKVVFQNENDDDPSNDRIQVFFKGLDQNNLPEGKHTWSVTAYDQAGNPTTIGEEILVDKTKPQLQTQAFILQTDTTQGALGWQLIDSNTTTPQEIILNSQTRMPSFSGKLEDLYRGSAVTNSNGSQDTFDSVSSGPAKIILNIKKKTSNSNSLYTYSTDLNWETNLLSDSINWTNYLQNFEYTLTDIQDKKSENNHQSSRFYFTLPYALEDGYYQVNLSFQDKTGNKYEYPVFYLSLNQPQSASNQYQNYYSTNSTELTHSSNSVLGEKDENQTWNEEKEENNKEETIKSVETEPSQSAGGGQQTIKPTTFITLGLIFLSLPLLLLILPMLKKRIKP